MEEFQVVFDVLLVCFSEFGASVDVEVAFVEDGPVGFAQKAHVEIDPSAGFDEQYRCSVVVAGVEEYAGV